MRIRIQLFYFNADSDPVFYSNVWILIQLFYFYDSDPAFHLTVRIRIQPFTFMLIRILLFIQMCESGSSFFTFMLIRILLFTQTCGS